MTTRRRGSRAAAFARLVEAARRSAWPGGANTVPRRGSFVAVADAVQHLVTERDGPIVVDERAAQLDDVHVADPFAGLGVAAKDREPVQAAVVDVMADRGFAQQ